MSQVFSCGSASFWCRSGSDFPFWCQSRYGSCTIFYTYWKLYIFLDFIAVAVSVVIILNDMCHNFQYFGQYINWNSLVKKQSLALHLVETDMNPFQLRIWISRPWLPVRIWMWIRQNNADPTGSGFKTLFLSLTGGNLAGQMGVHNQLSLLRHLSKKRDVVRFKNM